MDEPRTKRPPFRLGDETYAGRPRRPWAMAAGLAAAGLVDAGLGLSGLAGPVVVVSGCWRSGTTYMISVGDHPLQGPGKPERERAGHGAIRAPDRGESRGHGRP